MQSLPIDTLLPAIVASLRDRRALVLVAQPGAGKTTRVPPAILAAGLLPPDHPNLVMLQPRRVAARAAAMRIADEHGWTVGHEVGHHVRFDRKISANTRLRVLTEGILTRQLLDDPLLDGVGCVILDEFHERNLNTDLAIALLREVREARPDLLLVVMSATLDAEAAARFLGDCPILRSDGRLFPVAVTHAAAPSSESIWSRAAAASAAAWREGDGDVLAFLPGADEIRRTLGELSRLVPDAIVLPLYGALSAEEQIRAIQPGSDARRRIIVATNIAETSLTIPGVMTVIDAGLERIPMFDPRRGLDRLDVSDISKASAIQRAGRAGRVKPGRCVRLYTEKQFHAFADFQSPDIQRVDLAQTVLTLHAWGRPDPRTFPWFDPPPMPTLDAAERLLSMLGALTTGPSPRLTAMGRRMLAIPAHPRLARLLLAGEDAGIARHGATLAGLLAERDIFPPQWTERGRIGDSRTQSDSDLLLRLDAFDAAERDGFRPNGDGIDMIACRQVAKLREEFLRAIAHRVAPGGAAPAHRILASRPVANRDSVDGADPDDATLLRLPLAAYPDRVCRRRENDPAAAAMVGGGGVRLADESSVHDAEFFLALDARHDPRSPRGEATVRIASAIESDWLRQTFPDLMRTEIVATFDPALGRVVGLRRDWFADLLIAQRPGVEPLPDAIAAALRPALLGRLPGVDWLAELRVRLTFAGGALPDDAALADQSRFGARSLEEALKNIRHAVDAAISFELRRRLDDLAPEAIAVPTGNRIRLDWSSATPADPARGPVLAVRLQELFGLPDTPTVGRGIPVILHLLGPNHRPVQVTADLASFWKNTYPRVRKDLRARYPKHSWPDDPLAAPPQAKGARRRPAT